MSIPILSCVEEVGTSPSAGSSAGPSTIRCYVYIVLASSPPPRALGVDRQLAAQAMTLLMRIDGELKEARADWNQNRFRRLMRTRSKAVSRLARRWSKLRPKPTLRLGSLTRRYHANIANYLYKPQP